MNLIFERLHTSKINVNYALKLWTEAQKESASITDKAGNVIFGYDILAGTVSDFYFNYFSILHHSEENISAEEAATMIFNRFQRWKNERQNDIRKSFSAMREVYNPVYTYEKYEDEATDVDEIRHGKKTATNTDIKTGKNTDVKESKNTNLKEATASNLKTEHSTNVKASSASDLTSEVNTDVKETEGKTVKADKRPTWLADNQTTAGEEVTPGDRRTQADKGSNYTHTSGTAAGNYTQTVGDASGNFDRMSGGSEDNYTLKSGDASTNYNHTQGLYNDNYERTEGDEDDNYKIESGTTTDTKTIGERHTYGRDGGNAADLIEAELNLRRRNLIHEYIDEWINSISYSMEVLG